MRSAMAIERLRPIHHKPGPGLCSRGYRPEHITRLCGAVRIRSCGIYGHRRLHDRFAEFAPRCFLFHRLTRLGARSEEHTSELQSLMRISYAVFCLKKKKKTHTELHTRNHHHKPK